MATGMNLGPGSGKVGGMLTYAGETVTIAAGGTAVVVAGTTTKRGDSEGFTVGATGIMTATFPGTRLCRICAALKLAPIATNTDNLTLHIEVNDVSVFESANNDIPDTAPEDYLVEYVGLVSNGDTIKLYVENEDSTADIIVAAYVDQIDNEASSGYLVVSG